MADIEHILRTIASLSIKPNSVIVYDIDSTLIDNYGNPIHPIIHTYRYALQKGLKPIIITARPGSDEGIRYTLQQLKSFGIDRFLAVYFMPEEKRDQALYKKLSRKDIHDKGYRVEMSLGDMPWDIGEYGGIGFIV